MNPVLILTRNNLSLTKRCVDSVRRQDIPAKVCIIDNGSTDGTKNWVEDNADWWCCYEQNQGVSRGWNDGLCGEYSNFMGRTWQHCLVIGNDTVLAPWTYRSLLSCEVPFVTGVDIGMNPLPEFAPNPLPMAPHPDFSCFLIRREAWEKIGQFDERMVSYAGDCDYHVRAHRLGIPLWKANVPYNHERSSTMNRATPQERQFLNWQANKDREAFKAIYGCVPGTAAYSELFK